MPTYPHIESYYTELNDLIQFGGSDNELSIRGIPELPIRILLQTPRKPQTNTRASRPKEVYPTAPSKTPSAWLAATGKPKTPTTT